MTKGKRKGERIAPEEQFLLLSRREFLEACKTMHPCKFPVIQLPCVLGEKERLLLSVVPSSGSGRQSPNCPIYSEMPPLVFPLPPRTSMAEISVNALVICDRPFHDPGSLTCSLDVEQFGFCSLSLLFWWNFGSG
ncbi:hypothetical protein SAY87_004173 [Trapa incisa]|uniref:Uncharacterized protein n=2 Tax=Trapa TaxID=22665 RepID=A0AAN7LE17_TRANT|nr:hypothetical protein SAY87_004173 [Trapa incisa]KAK4782564.1 hypothetical protein SAY86_016666 [Trapa natans]